MNHIKQKEIGIFLTPNGKYKLHLRIAVDTKSNKLLIRSSLLEKGKREVELDVVSLKDDWDDFYSIGNTEVPELAIG